MTQRRRTALVLAFGLLTPWWGSPARAHFLFCRIGPMAEGGRAAEVTFSEQAEAGDPRLAAKIARTRLWLRPKPGEFRPLETRQAPDRLRAILPAAGSLAVVGVCEYGVRTKAGQPSFLLRYYPKAVDGIAAELNALRPIGKEVPFEIVATLGEADIRLVALRDGRPVSRAKFTTIDASLANVTLEAGDDGMASWTPPAPGRYEVYTEATLKQSGAFEGTGYDEIREFATLSFTWPTSRSGADPEAVALFEKAVAERAQWRDFPGFSAEIAGDLDGRPFVGKVDVSAAGKVRATVDDAPAKKWVVDQLGSIVLHRRADSGAEATPVLRFADDTDHHPLGRLLAFDGGRFASSYRVKDGRITVVNRHIGKSNMTITTLGERKNAEGNTLPTAYVVHYWDATVGDLQRVETVQDRWERVGRLDLPASHVVTTAAAGGLSARGFTLSNHTLSAVAPR